MREGRFLQKQIITILREKEAGLAILSLGKDLPVDWAE